MDTFEGNKIISRSKAAVYIAIAVVISILSTAYIYNNINKRQLDEFVLTIDIAEAKDNVALARSLREGNIQNIVQSLDVKTGEDAVIFTDYRKFAPKKLHEDISETLEMIKAYRKKFKISASDDRIQNKIERSLNQVN